MCILVIWYFYPVWNGLCSLNPCLMLQQDKNQSASPYAWDIALPVQKRSPTPGPLWPGLSIFPDSRPIHPNPINIRSSIIPPTHILLGLASGALFMLFLYLGDYGHRPTPSLTTTLHMTNFWLSLHTQPTYHLSNLAPLSYQQRPGSGPRLDSHSSGKAPLPWNVPYSIEIIHPCALKWLEMSQK